MLQAISDLVATSLVSTNGNIVVHASNHVLVGVIEALGGNVTINAGGAIRDYNGDLSQTSARSVITLVSSATALSVSWVMT